MGPFLVEILKGLDRIAEALEELVEVQKTEPLSKIIHPSSTRPTEEDQ